MASSPPNDTLKQRAQALLNDGQSAAALALLQENSDAREHDPSHWFLLGAAQAENGLFDEAERSFNRVLSLVPGHVNASANLGRALCCQQRFSEAVEPLQQALLSSPAHRPARFALIDALTRLKRFDEAVSLCSELFSAEPANPDASIRLGGIYMMQGRLDEAISMFDRALAIAPESSYAMLNKGLAVQKSGNLDAAIALFERASRLAPGMDSAWSSLATALLAKSDIAGAISGYEQAVTANPANIDAADKLARLYRHTGRGRESLEVYKNILQVQPDHVRARFFLDAYTSQENDNGPARIPASIALDIYKDEDAGFRFDSSLQSALDYRAPDVLNEAVREAIDVPEGGIDILELGCGSGLCGSKLADIARKLTGTDLSANMLAAARAKNVYDELYEADLVDVLSQTTDMADLIIAMDVLCFFGDLQAIFEKSHRALRPNGVFGFSVVKPDGVEPWELNKYGHFAHSPVHLQAVAGKTGFERIFFREIVMRRELNEERRGYICLYRRV